VRDRIRQAYNAGYDQGYADVHGPVIEESRIVPGDKVECGSFNETLVVLEIDNENGWLSGLDKCGKIQSVAIGLCRKTGEHYDACDELIEKVRGE
jgi:hypothetical protein